MANASAPAGPRDPDGEPTPGDLRFEATRERIIKAAETVFAEHGHEGFTLGRIAALVHYRPSALYKYFESKAAIIDCVREKFFDRLLVRLAEVEKHPWSMARMHEGLTTYITTALEEPNHYRMAFMSSEVGPPGEDSATWRAAAHLQRMIAEGVERGDFDPCDIALTSKSVWASLHGLTLLMADEPRIDMMLTDQPCPDEACPDARGPFYSDQPAEAMIARHVDILLRGLAKTPG